jgi:unsaturated chondroitin disaccharide hydrolase
MTASQTTASRSTHELMTSDQATDNPTTGHPFPESWQRALDFLCERVYAIRKAVGDAWPYHYDPVTGVHDTVTDGDWCGGHWVESLRIVGELTGDRALELESAERTERLRPYLERDDMFRGHRFYYSAARQYAWTGDRKFRTLAIAGAYAVRSMAIPSNGAMPIGTQVQVRSTKIFGREKVCIDNVHPNLILDWWALTQTADPTFLEGARRHLDLTARDFILPDHSTVEFIDYDVATGAIARPHYTLLGAHDSSCWSRGHAWAVAGYLRAWEATREPRYLAIGTNLLNYWRDNTDESWVPPYDFKDPKLETDRASVPLDTSAAAVVVEQLARLAVMPRARRTAAEAPALQALAPMIDGLLGHLTGMDGKATSNRERGTTAVDRERGATAASRERGATAADRERGVTAPRLERGILLDGCFNQPKNYATRSELIWGTAYLLFALYYLKTGRVVE